eukprot:scaffold154100_cov18-Prasinocladus_malaysianus.AAC.1
MPFPFCYVEYHTANYSLLVTSLQANQALLTSPEATNIVNNIRPKNISTRVISKEDAVSF